MATPIDLNADLGEGFGIWQLGDDEGLLEVVTSANVACGFHGGDPSIMRRVCAQAADRGVAIGAQVGYRDLAGFGRRRIEMDPAELEADVMFQIAALDGFARAAGDRVRYVKPHGALYHASTTDAAVAGAVVGAIEALGLDLAVLGPPDSELLRCAEAGGLVAVREAFADRAYTSTGRLVPRSEAGAVLHDGDLVAARSVELATAGTVRAVDGGVIHVGPRSLCVHGDTPGAVGLARRIRAAIERAGVPISPFVAG